MSSKEFHQIRIKELEFQRDSKKNQDNRTHMTLIALLSVIVIFLSYELRSNKVNIGWLIFLYIAFVFIIWAINKKIQYKEDEIIQRNFDALIGRKK